MKTLGQTLSLLALLLAAGSTKIQAGELPVVAGVDWQPLRAQIQRLNEALELLGAPLPRAERGELEAILHKEEWQAAEEVQKVLDRHVLFGVNINPESRVKVAQGAASPRLTQGGWRTFLVKIHNEAGVTSELRMFSPNGQSEFSGGSFANASDRFFRRKAEDQAAVSDRWLDLQMFTKQPMRPALSGLGLEYRVAQLYSRDKGMREARFMFDVGQGTQDLGFRNQADVLFECEGSHTVRLKVSDEHGQPTTAMFLVKDAQGNVYPSQAKRLAPDFGFHPQVYRADGETLELPFGSYRVEFARGPESLPEVREVNVTPETGTLEFKVKRWVDPSTRGWWSGDHHIHAAGCAHYTKPTEGVHAPDMMRHCLGEDLKVGANLTWGPCFDYQKQFFKGTDDPVSQHPYLLRYDIEVSGFGSHQSGHLCLLRLKEQMYPGGDSTHHWPSLCLNTLKWAKAQGALTGPAHSGWGLQVPTAELPNYVIPPFDGIGANEYIVDVTHEVPTPGGKLERAVDFISTVDTPYVWELNIWYHTLNVGYRTRISGETDFPCIYGERVGLGRSYVKLDGKLTYEDWCEGIRQGRNYVGDGRSHLMDFKANGVELGVGGSELKLPSAGKVKLSSLVAAYLPEEANREIKNRPYDQQPYWHIERARQGEGRTVKVEAIVNGRPVATKEVEADGASREIAFEIPIERSSWVALRILPSSHTNPIFVVVDEKPIRASKKSAEWCLSGVEKCWSQKQRFIKAEEMEEAKAAYDHARVEYRRLISESPID